MEHFSTLEGVALQFWEHLATPHALSQAIRLRYGMTREVLTSSVTPEMFVDPLEYSRSNAAFTFLKKNPYFEGATEEERVQVAKANWYSGEQRCRSTNERLAKYVPTFGYPPERDVPGVFLQGVCRNFRSMIGERPSDESIQLQARHGPGTTFASLVRDPTAADKFSEKPTITRNAIWHLANLVGTKWGQEIALRYTPPWSELGTTPANRGGYADCVNVIRGDRFTTAAKDALKHRGIVIGPSINTYFQLGVGRCMRNRLRRNTGWDLDSCADIHREVAQQASLSGDYATIDLRNASDSLCKNLVKILAHDPDPPITPVKGERTEYRRLSRDGWLSLLEDLRCTHTYIDDRWIYLEKFSGMGNGYTFELETVAFAAIASECLKLNGHAGVLGLDLFVFGDDIIVPTDAAGLVIAALEFCGFEVNKEKSFVAGPFRESCGGDYFLGHPVRGPYFKRDLDAPDDVFQCHNLVRRYSATLGTMGDSLRTGTCGWLLEKLPVHLRKIGGSERLGDTVLHGVRERYKWKDQIRWVQQVRWERPRVIPWTFYSDDVRLTCRLLGYGSSIGISSRGSVPSWKMTWVSGS